MLARRRAGKGGGLEYHVNLLPESAGLALLKRRPSATPAAPVAPIGEGDAWTDYERLGARAKARAAEALIVIQAIETLTQRGVGKTSAINTVAVQANRSVATINNWFSAIRGVPAEDRLPHLAPGFKGGGRKAELDEGLWQALCSDFLRMAMPSWESCCRRTAELAAARGLTLPHYRTLWRRFESTVDPQVVTLLREGIDALRRHLPPQKRTVADLHALELVNIDGHTCDVRVNWPGYEKPIRPTLVAIQDVYSRKFLAWRYAPSEDALTARGVFLDLFERYGIPNGLLSDNGRAFACKWLTGGIATRFRFKVKDGEPIGLMRMLGIEVHWALPYRGQSKPIERGFGDFCKSIARHPAFNDYYTGNSPTNKPANYDSEKGIDLDTFIRVWDAGIAEHNRRSGRGTEMARGVDSFDEVFARSYASAPIRKATPAHLRLAMMAGEQVRANRDTGAVKVLGNSYWCDELTHVAGQIVTVRFDAEDATRPVDVYLAEKLIATAPLWEMTGFLNKSAANRRGKLVADHLKTTKAAAAALDLLTADQLAAQFADLLPDYEDELPPSPTVIRPVRVRGNGGAAVRKVFETDAERPAEPQFIDTLVAGMARLRSVRGE